MIFAFTVLFCIGLAYLLSSVAKMLRIPEVVGLILTGIIIDIPQIKNAIIGPNQDMIQVIGEIGLLAILFIAGLEISWTQLYRERRDSLIVAIFASLTPFLLGFVVFKLLGFSNEVSLAVSICMSITAEATKARVLMELDKLKTKLGALMMGAGLIDDFFGIVLLLFIGAWAGNSSFVGEEIILISALVAFFVGIFIHIMIGRKTSQIRYFEKAALVFVVPFFFISMGLDFNFQSLVLHPGLLVAIIIVAIVGKLAGTMMAKPFLNLSMKQLFLVGWGMNSRGAVELAIAFILFRMELLPISLYSAIILMALVTTLIFPVVIYKMVGKDPKIMD